MADVRLVNADTLRPLIAKIFEAEGAPAINPEHFMPLDEFRARVDRLVGMVKASERAAGVEEVYIAGEIEFRRKAERLKNGIPLSDVVYQELKTLAAECGAPFALR